MRQIFYSTSFIFSFLLIGFLTVAQEAPAPVTILETAEAKYLQEKIYLQTDKNAYTSGENIWFKAYLTMDNAPMPMSKTMYAELIKENGQVLDRKMMPVILSGASSDFIIPDSLQDTKLFIRAYTAWMLNFDSTLLCVKPIQLVPKKTTAKKVVTPDTYGVTFFPEGGDLVEGIQSFVAFKANNQEGKPFAIKGDIVNNAGKVLTNFSAVHDGMGYFTLQPAAGETYKAVWTDKNKQKHESPLPAAKKDGATLGATFSDRKLFYTINRPATASEAFTRFTVVAQMQQHLVYSAQINLSKKNAVTAPLPTDSLADGVLQITLFNGDMLPIAERLVYVNNNNYSFITDLHLAEKSLVKHGRTVVQVDVGGTILSNMSIAVTDADINPVGKNEENIYSALLLSADLKGGVYNPAYYFSSDEDSVRQHLDLVMMTNGWRRFKWEKLLANQWPEIKYQPENFLSLQGQVLGLTRAQMYGRDVSAILKVKNTPPQFLNLPVDAKGNFKADGMYFFDTAKVFYQMSNDKNKDITTAASFSFVSNYIKAPVMNKDLVSAVFIPERIDSALANKANALAALRKSQESNLAKTKTLDEVKVITKQKSPVKKLDEQYTSGFFSGGDGYSFDIDGDPSARSSIGLLEYLQGKVAGLQISTQGEGGATWRGSSPTFFLNEMQSDISMIRSINMSDVAYVKVFRPPFFGATGGGAGGAIAVYTKKGGGDNSSFKGLPNANINGYSAIREFYSPDYSNPAEPDAKDYRTTLYWNPHVYFDKNSRRIMLPFYNSDNCKRIRVIVEGINEQGLLSREEKIFE